MLQVWGLALVLGSAMDATAACRSAALDFTTRDMSLELGEYGTMFREASLPECQTVVRDQLLRKLRLSLGETARLDPVLGRRVRTFERWLAGANIGLAIPTVMQLNGAAIGDAQLDQAVRATIAAYRFNIDPACGTNLLNECMDDFTQAAVAYAWSAAYTRDPALAAVARAAIHDALAPEHHVCKTLVDAMPQRCDLAMSDEVISFNHGFENVAYGLGLMTSISSAAIALDEAGSPLMPTEDESRIAWGLFREGQRRTLTDGSAFRSDCYRVAGLELKSDSPCADADYLPRMFPVRTLYERLFHNAPNEEPYRFDEFDPALFRTVFINDGRFAVYVELGKEWWLVRPRLDRYEGAPLRARAVRH